MEDLYRNMRSGSGAAHDAPLAAYFSRDGPFPVEQLARLVCGLGQRRMALSRRRREPDGDTYKWLCGDETPCTGRAFAAMCAPVPSALWPTPPFLSLHVGHAMTRRRNVAAAARTLIATERELMLDLDLRDWERARPLSRSLLCACSDTEACARCWLLVELSAAAMRAWLSIVCDLGPMLVVFSGGKGAHFWFGSAAARALTQQQRQHLATLFAHAARDPHRPELATVRAAVMAVWRTRGLEHRP